MYPHVILLEQLSLAELSSDLARLKVYENRHENVLGIWINLVLTIRNFDFQSNVKN